VASGQEIRLPFDDDVEAWGVAFDSAGKFLIAGTSAGLRCWSIVWEHLQDGDRLVLGHEERFGPVCSTGSVFVNGTGNVLATSCGNAFQVYEWPSRSHLRSLSMGTNAWPVWGGVLSPSGRLGLGWPFKPDQPRRAWDIATGSGLKDLPSAGIYGGAFTHDDRLLIAGSSDEYVAWDTHSWTNLWKLPRQNSGDTHAQVALARDGTLGALTLSAQTIRLFDTQTGREFATLEAPEPETLGGLAFSPDDSALAATTSSGSIHLWDLRLIRQELAAMNLDWDAPPLPPAQTTSAPLVIISTDSGHPPQHPAALQIPRRDPACSTNQIDLSKFYNASLLDSWFNPKWEQNNLAALPRGLQTMDGILFDIRGVVQLSSTHRDLAIAYPPQVESIPVQRNCRMLHFLQSAGFPYENGGEIGAYIIRYADGVQRSVPLIYGENIQDWWLTSGVSPVLKSGVAVGWRGQNPICASNGKDLLLFHLRWENPRPEAAIESITFRSGMTQCAPFLIAITTE
jgi:hypothetical protein